MCKQAESMPQSPRDKARPNAVPQPASDHRRDVANKQYRCGVVLPVALEQITAQWKEDIVAQPVRQGNVPRLPEPGDSRLRVGIGKILRQPQPHQPYQTNRNVAISGKIK